MTECIVVEVVAEILSIEETEEAMGILKTMAQVNEVVRNGSEGLGVAVVVEVQVIQGVEVTVEGSNKKVVTVTEDLPVMNLKKHSPQVFHFFLVLTFWRVFSILYIVVVTNFTILFRKGVIILQTYFLSPMFVVSVF